MDESLIDELACLHKQVTERVPCTHFPRHEDCGDALIRGLGTTDPITQKAIRAATRPRSLPRGWRQGYHGR